MLVLSRKCGQRILIGNAEIVVCSIKPDQVRLGIVAPADVPVDREEVRRRKEESAQRRALRRLGAAAARQITNGAPTLEEDHYGVAL